MRYLWFIIYETTRKLAGQPSQGTGVLQALPIWRGGGVDQPLLLDVARRAANSDWVHVFPEGRVIQSGRLGRDDISTRTEEEARRIGRLKWGVGKLVAHSPSPPIVTPWHHRGMAAVLPQNAVWRDDGRGGRYFDNKVKSWVPRAGNRVTVEFGPDVQYQDLILAHEQARPPPCPPPLFSLSSSPAPLRVPRPSSRPPPLSAAQFGSSGRPTPLP